MHYSSNAFHWHIGGFAVLKQDSSFSTLKLNSVSHKSSTKNNGTLIWLLKRLLLNFSIKILLAVFDIGRHKQRLTIDGSYKLLLKGIEGPIKAMFQPLPFRSK